MLIECHVPEMGILFPRCLSISSTAGSLNGPHSRQCNNTVVMESTVDCVVPGTGNSWNSRYMVHRKLVAHSLVLLIFLLSFHCYQRA